MYKVDYAAQHAKFSETGSTLNFGLGSVWQIIYVGLCKHIYTLSYYIYVPLPYVCKDTYVVNIFRKSAD